MPFTPTMMSDKIIESAYFAGIANFFWLKFVSSGIWPARNTCNAVDKDMAKRLCDCKMIIMKK